MPTPFPSIARMAGISRRFHVVWMVGMAALAMVVANLLPRAEGDEPRPLLYREGQAVRGLQGHIEDHDGRLVFESLDKKLRVPILENLALERVARALDDSIAPLTWSVTGTMTEYRGHNFLLLQSARLSERE